jgi:putative tryptophan/tyrosine transport system substrate-binding protein
MRRREFIAVAAGVATLPFGASAQQNIPVIGFLDLNPKNADNILAEVRRGLAENGYVEGRDFQFDYRWSDYHSERLTANAVDLVQRGVAAILMFKTQDVLVAKAATKSIPIVFWIGSDPVVTGIVSSLNRPGGNLTGCYNLNMAVIGKRLEVLHELVPAVTSIAYFVNPRNEAYSAAETKALQSAADALGVQLLIVNIATPNDIEAAFAKLLRERAGALFVGGDALFYSHRDRLAPLAAHHAIPAIFAAREYVTAGGLISFGTRYSDGYRLVGNYTAHILKGEKPSDLPVQQITTSELVINLEAAKSLGLTVPSTLLARADEVIE